jgi:cobalt-zinc-cadmium efflux system outer membrane protein
MSSILVEGTHAPCAKSRDVRAIPQNQHGRRLRRFFTAAYLAIAGLPIGVPAFAESIGTDRATPAGDLGLRNAIDRALAADPNLKAGAIEIEAAEGRKVQAGLSPNPQASVEVEDSGGTGGYRGFRRTQTTLQISQLFELGGKLDRRVEAANAARDVIRADRELLRLDVMARTTEAFVKVLGAQRRLSIAETRAKRAATLIPALRRRVDAGASSNIEVTRGQVAVDLANIETGHARAALDTARRNLASQWGGTTPDFAQVTGDLDAISQPPPLESFITGLDDNPRLARWSTVRSAREAEVRVQRSLATPDLTFGIGPRHYAETNDAGVVFNLSMPIPVNNRNQGNITEARKELEKTGEERSAARLDLYRELSSAYGELSESWAEINQLRGSVLPAARDALRGVQVGYGQGRFGAIDLLDAQGTLSEAESRYGDALVAYHAAVARIEGLTARPLFSLNASTRSN